eukprot:1112439-Prorocentrum_minimum.AAC.1
MWTAGSPPGSTWRRARRTGRCARWRTASSLGFTDGAVNPPREGANPPPSPCRSVVVPQYTPVPRYPV